MLYVLLFVTLCLTSLLKLAVYGANSLRARMLTRTPYAPNTKGVQLVGVDGDTTTKVRTRVRL